MFRFAKISYIVCMVLGLALIPLGCASVKTITTKDTSSSGSESASFPEQGEINNVAERYTQNAEAVIEFGPLEFPEPNPEQGEIWVFNRADTNSLSNVTFYWNVEADGAEVYRQKMSMPGINPGEGRKVQLSFPKIKYLPGVEYFLKLWGEVESKDQVGNEYANTIAWRQYKLDRDLPSRFISSDQYRSLQVKEKERSILVAGDGFKITFDLATANIVSWLHQGREIIHLPLRTHFWQASRDNLEREKFAFVKNVQEQVTVKNFLMVANLGDYAQFSADIYRGDNVIHQKMTYTIYNSGDLVIDVQAIPQTNLALWPSQHFLHMGMRLESQSEFTQARWFGRSSPEFYKKDNFLASVSRYEKPILKQRPGAILDDPETLNRDVRWYALLREDVSGLLITAEEPFMVSALSKSEKHLESKTSDASAEQASKATTTIQIDYQPKEQEWEAPLLPLPIQAYTFGFRLRPFTADEDPAVIARRMLLN